MNHDYTCKNYSRPVEEKPPLGLIPQRSWKAMRIDEIKAAIQRYMEADKPIPIEWVEE